MQLSPSKNLSNFIASITYLIPISLQTFNPSYYGNEVTNSSDKISLALFHSNWYKQSKKFKVAMKMLMENTKRSIVINAGRGLFPVNLNSFLSIINSAYSMYAVLQSQYEA